MVKIMKRKFYIYTTIILILSLACSCTKQVENESKNIYTEDQIEAGLSGGSGRGSDLYEPHLCVAFEP